MELYIDDIPSARTKTGLIYVLLTTFTLMVYISTFLLPGDFLSISLCILTSFTIAVVSLLLYIRYGSKKYNNAILEIYYSLYAKYKNTFFDFIFLMAVLAVVTSIFSFLDFLRHSISFLTIIVRYIFSIFMAFFLKGYFSLGNFIVTKKRSQNFNFCERGIVCKEKNSRFIIPEIARFLRLVQKTIFCIPGFTGVYSCLLLKQTWFFYVFVLGFVFFGIGSGTIILFFKVLTALSPGELLSALFPFYIKCIITGACFGNFLFSKNFLQRNI